jgi:hypothetical protein
MNSKNKSGDGDYWLSDELLEKALTYDPEATEVVHRENKGAASAAFRALDFVTAAALAAEKSKGAAKS